MLRPFKIQQSMQHNRNLPQLAIQILYIMDVGNIDLLVFNAMLFSIFSIMFGLSQAISRLIKKRYINKVEYYYCKRKNFQMKIECKKFKNYHKYTHNTITRIICSVLGIDNDKTIEIFYIVPGREAIILHMEVLRTQVKEGENIFTNIKQLGDAISPLCIAFKQELNSQLNLGINEASLNIHAGPIAFSDINFNESEIKIHVMEERERYSVDKRSFSIVNMVVHSRSRKSTVSTKRNDNPQVTKTAVFEMSPSPSAYSMDGETEL